MYLGRLDLPGLANYSPPSAVALRVAYEINSPINSHYVESLISELPRSFAIRVGSATFSSDTTTIYLDSTRESLSLFSKVRLPVSARRGNFNWSVNDGEKKRFVIADECIAIRKVQIVQRV